MLVFLSYIAQSAGSVEYIDCISAEKDSLTKCPSYDTEQSDNVAAVMLKLRRKQSIPSLQLLPGPLWSGVVASDRVLSMGRIELFNHLLKIIISELKSYSCEQIIHIRYCPQSAGAVGYTDCISTAE